MKLPKFTILFLALFGAIFLGTIIHESVHLAQAKEVYSICYDVNQKSFAHIDGDFENKQYASLEIPAYVISILTVLVLMVCIFIDFRLRQKS
ncbi:MAG: hypothetical protein AABW57_01655 [Nanoarchaeota archaeon]